MPALFEEVEAAAVTGTDAGSELLRTIKLSKNVFKLSLPEPTYSSGANPNFQTIPGSQALGAQAKRSQTKNGNSKSPNGMKMISNITKTTAITTSKASLGSNGKPGVDDINVSVGLPNIKGNKNHLASIDDDYEEDYEERVPSKPKNLHHTPTQGAEQ